MCFEYSPSPIISPESKANVLNAKEVWPRKFYDHTTALSNLPKSADSFSVISMFLQNDVSLYTVSNIDSVEYKSRKLDKPCLRL